jgi:hypothetical protein
MTDDDFKKDEEKGTNTVPPDLFEEAVENVSISIIFHELPFQWGYRGDPYLWKEFDTHFSNILLPCSEELFLNEFNSAFEKYTGSKFDSEVVDIFVPRYDHGGMSTGMISLSFWSEKALPLLIQRLRQANSRLENEVLFKEKPNSELKLKDIPKKFESDWEAFALSFNGYKFAGDVCLNRSNQLESYFEGNGDLPGHLTLSELRMCLFSVQRRFRHNGDLPSMDYIEHLYNAMREKVRTKPSALPENQRTSFGLYNKRRATFFDLIDGDQETKQTKGLAYLFSSCPKFLELFIDHTLSGHGVTVRDFDYIAVDAEMKSVDTPPLRRDITVSCYLQNIKKCVIVIEAKTIKGSTADTVESQLHCYMDVGHFPQDSGIPILGISLTKHRYVFEPGSPLLSVTWIELIQWLWNFVSDDSSAVAKEYLDFLMKVEHGMHFYEAEVLSLAAKKTKEELQEFHIYACANHKKHPTALFMAFRGAGGVMDTLYKVERVFVADPKHPSFEEQVSFLPQAERERVLFFVEKRREGYGFKYNEEYRFYILSETEKILLPHKPRPKVVNQSKRVYNLATILSGEEMI